MTETALHLPVIGGDGSTSERSAPPSFVDMLLREQDSLSAVERFSQFHERGEGHLQEKYYRSLLPTSPPKSGQQYGFEVDLDRCTGCKACVTACHNLNGLEEDEAWRSVGMLHGGTSNQPTQKTVTTACHHCLDPACMKGCPVEAYEKDPETGIVRHLDDQCIGCQYCIFTCPYEVPKYSEKLGIVRKCDMCSDRLAEGEAPACVQACPNEAIRIRVVDTASVAEDAEGDVRLPGTPSPQLTRPSTRYLSRQPLEDTLRPADAHALRPAHQHRPLVVMLVLTQLSVGAFLAEQLLVRSMGTGLSGLRPVHAVMALTWGLVALAASVAHLGRPLHAWRAFLGVRTSWLSREILAFGAFAKLGMLYAASVWVAETSVAPGLQPVARTLETILGPTLCVVGLGAVGCSVMLYHVTGRAWFHVQRSGFKFFMTSAILGLSATLATVLSAHLVVDAAVSAEALRRFARGAVILLASATVLKLFGEASVFRHLSTAGRTDHDEDSEALRRSALLLSGDLAAQSWLRFGFGVLGGVVLPLLSLSWLFTGRELQAAAASVLGLAFSVLAELLERAGFFSALSSPRMPGGLS